MTEAEWLVSESPGPMLDFLGLDANLRKLRLFGVACCLMIWDEMTDEESRRAVLVAEQYAHGQASCETLSRANLAAGRAGSGRGDFGFAAARAAEWVSWVVQPGPGDVLDTLDAMKTCMGWVKNYPRPSLEIRAVKAALIRDIFGNPFRRSEDESFRFSPLFETIAGLARSNYEDRAFDTMPILGDALEEAGCNDESILQHCRSGGPHVRGCWVVDLILGKT